MLLTVWTVGLEAGLFLRDGAAKGNTVSFDAMFNRSPAICLHDVIYQIHTLLCFVKAVMTKVVCLCQSSPERRSLKIAIVDHPSAA